MYQVAEGDTYSAVTAMKKGRKVDFVRWVMKGDVWAAEIITGWYAGCTKDTWLYTDSHLVEHELPRPAWMPSFA